MKRLSGLLLVIIFVLGLSSVSLAQTGWINRRERQQSLRIRQGIRSHELTRREAARLTAEQARIRAYERRSRIDGRGLSWRERARLDNMLDRSRRHIYRQKHDRQDRIP
ncbi:MAG TPA: hypothetical protein VF131_03980 [Blastocatellia bacterium]|nr:hypothetical protein [Blastocatellia bacterium]